MHVIHTMYFKDAWIWIQWNLKDYKKCQISYVSNGNNYQRFHLWIVNVKICILMFNWYCMALVCASSLQDFSVSQNFSAPLGVSSERSYVTLCLMVWDWRVLRAEPILSCWHDLLFFVSYYFIFFLPWVVVWGSGLWTDSVLTLSGLAQRTPNNNNNNNNNLRNMRSITSEDFKFDLY